MSGNDRLKQFIEDEKNADIEAAAAKAAALKAAQEANFERARMMQVWNSETSHQIEDAVSHVNTELKGGGIPAALMLTPSAGLGPRSYSIWTNYGGQVKNAALALELRGSDVKLDVIVQTKFGKLEPLSELIPFDEFDPVDAIVSFLREIKQAIASTTTSK